MLSPALMVALARSISASTIFIGTTISSVGDGAQHEQHLDAMLGALAVLLAQRGLVLLGDAQVVLVADALLGRRAP